MAEKFVRIRTNFGTRTLEDLPGLLEPTISIVSEQTPVYVLVVEDTPEVRLATRTLLETPWRVIVTAETGEDALTKLGLHDYALALLDVQLPGIDGFAVAEAIRREEATRHLPIIFFTGVRFDEKHIFRGYETGAVDYLVHPVDPHTMRSKVEVFCELQVQRQRIAEYVTEIETKNVTLERNLVEINTLQGLIPICCNCKKVRDDDGFWQQVEIYIMERSDAQFTHGICVTCSEELYGE